MTFAEYIKLSKEGNGDPLEYLKERDDMLRFEFLNDHAGYRAPKQLY